MSEQFRIGVVDDHPLYRNGIVDCMAADPAIRVVATGASGQDARRIAEIDQPDLLMLDWKMPGGGANLLGELRGRWPEVQLLVLTGDDSEATLSAALTAGASGFVLKSVGGAELMTAVKAVLTGQSYVTPELAARLLSRRFDRNNRRDGGALQDLSAREDEILRRVANGQSNKEVARTLDLSEKTVKHYMTTIMQKLNVRNRVEAAALVHREGPRPPLGS